MVPTASQPGLFTLDDGDTIIVDFAFQNGALQLSTNVTNERLQIIFSQTSPFTSFTFLANSTLTLTGVQGDFLNPPSLNFSCGNCLGVGLRTDLTTSTLSFTGGQFVGVVSTADGPQEFDGASATLSLNGSSIQIVPEPSAAPLLLTTCALGLALRRRMHPWRASSW